MHEYIIPTIHLRNRYPFREPPLIEGDGIPTTIPQLPGELPDMLKPGEDVPLLVEDGKNHGLKVGVLKLKNHKAKNQLRVMCGLLE